MILKLNCKDGYFTCNRTEINKSQLTDYDGVCLKQNGNSFGWDVMVEDNNYNFSLYVKWTPGMKVIKAGYVSLTFHYLDINNSLYKSITLKNQKLLRTNGNLLKFQGIRIRNTNGLTIELDSKVDLVFNELQINFNGSTKIELITIKHSAGNLYIEDKNNKPFNGFYREFNIKQHYPYTNYSINFNEGYYNIYIDGNKNGISFTLNHNRKYKSILLARNNNTITRVNKDNCSILFPINIVPETTYKIFTKLENTEYDGKYATMYHAFCGYSDKSKWYYMGTICREDNSEFSNTECRINNEKYNGHLYTRMIKYGNGWNFNNEKGIPIEEMKCFSDNSYKNSKTLLYNPTFKIRMFLGGFVHTTTPNDLYHLKRQSKESPSVPLKFSLINHLENDVYIEDKKEPDKIKHISQLSDVQLEIDKVDNKLDNKVDNKLDNELVIIEV
jgi:hypothetical protein